MNIFPPILCGLINHFIRGSTWYDKKLPFKSRSGNDKILTVTTNKWAAAIYMSIILTVWAKNGAFLWAFPLIWLSEVIGRDNDIFTGRFSHGKNKTIDGISRWIFNKVFDFNPHKGMLKKYCKHYGAIRMLIYGFLTTPLLVLSILLTGSPIYFYSLIFIYPLIRVLIYGSVNLFYWKIQDNFTEWENWGRPPDEKPLDYSLAYAECWSGFTVAYMIGLML